MACTCGPFCFCVPGETVAQDTREADRQKFANNLIATIPDTSKAGLHKCEDGVLRLRITLPTIYLQEFALAVRQRDELLEAAKEILKSPIVQINYGRGMGKTTLHKAYARLRSAVEGAEG